MAQIPMDIVREILLPLPAESLVRCREVCPEWRNTIDGKSFIHSHTISSQLSPTNLLFRNPSSTLLYFISVDSLITCADHNEVNLEATCVSGSVCSGISYFPLRSCNGLILLHPPIPEKYWVILNPCTQKFHQLSGLKGLLWCSHVGFGYDSSSDDYKVVAIGTYRFQRLGDPYYSFVYSMKTDSWRKIADVDLGDVSPDCCDGVFADGYLHWKSEKDYSLTRFNLATEFYDKVLLPKTDRECEVSFWDIGMLNGCLVVSLYYKEGKCLEGWVMKGGEWMKLFLIEDTYGFMMPIAYLEKKGLVLLANWIRQLLYLLDIETNSMRIVCIKGLPDDICSAICFSGSLVQLDRSHDARTGADAVKRIPVSLGRISLLDYLSSYML